MKYYVVDAFAEEVFKGNPAAVCVMDSWLSDEVMHNIAIENNLSETAFAVKKAEAHYGLRWFTPGGEIDLCGHATLATAFVILNYYAAQLESVRFTTQSRGDLTVTRAGALYELDFPVAPVRPLAADVAPLAEALGGVTPVEAYVNRDALVVLESEQQVRDLKPDFTKMRDLPDAYGLGVIVTARGDTHDFVSRAFFPKLDGDEDPVCGSAHCGMVPYWSERLKKMELVAEQVSARGGMLYCKLDGERVRMAGKAVLYAKGEMCF